MDAGNMLKPMLARGELRAIGATTLDEYRANIEKDPALERRFQPVLVEEPSVEDTIAILRGLKEKYEVHHGVRIQDPALVAAAVLSDRYVTGRFLPDKAIDLIDESASRLRIEIDSMPIEIDEVDAADPAARDRARRAPEGDRRRLEGTAGASGEGAGRPARASGGHDRALAAGEGAHREDPRAEGADRRGAQRVRAGRARRRPRARRRAPVRPAGRAGEAARGGERAARGAPVRAEDAEGRGHRGGRRRGRQQVDRHPGLAPDGGRDAEARPPGGGAARARRRPGRGGRGGRRTRSAGRARASPTRTGRSARSCSWGRPASARPSSPARSPTTCSTTSARSCAST